MLMKQAVVGFDDDNALWNMDVIEHEGEPWLVPEWLQNTAEGWMMPARIIRMRPLRYQEAPNYGGYILNDPMPKAVFEGRQPAKPPFEVVERPDIRILTGGTQ